MTTIKDVAKEAGLAVGTVSRVLNNRGYISEETREKVKKAMLKLDYQPNEVARTLSRKKSSLIGVIVPLVNHPYFAEFLDHIERVAQEMGYKILLLNSKGLAEKESEYLEFCRRNRVAGIILFFGLLDADKFSDTGIPIISIERHMENNIVSIECDNINGGQLAATHLIDLGCQHLLYVGGVIDKEDMSAHREKGFIEVCEARGIDKQVIKVELEGYYLPEDFSVIENSLLNDDIDGIFCSSDLIAVRVMKMAVALGKKIPEDIKIVGFDDCFMAAYTTPSLSSIHQPIDEMAKLAITYIDDIQNNKVVPTRSILPVYLAERGSTVNK